MTYHLERTVRSNVTLTHPVGIGTTTETFIAVLLATPPKVFLRGNVRNGDFWPRDARRRKCSASKIALNFWLHLLFQEKRWNGVYVEARDIQPKQSTLADPLITRKKTGLAVFYGLIITCAACVPGNIIHGMPLADGFSGKPVLAAVAKGI